MSSTVPLASSSYAEKKEIDLFYEEDPSLDLALTEMSESEWSKLCSTSDAPQGEKANSSIIDLTSSPEQPTNIVTMRRGSRRFGQDLTNSALLTKIDSICSSKQTQTRSFATVSSIYPPLPQSSSSKARTISVPSTSSVSRNSRYKGSIFKSRQKRKDEKELELRKLEKDLVEYTFKRPAGKIAKMCKKAEEIEAERADLQLSIFQGRTNSPRIAICPVHVPIMHICNSIEDSEECLKTIESGEVLSFDMEWKHDLKTHQMGKTSVIQLASATDIFILQVSMMSSLPKQLVRILSDPTILKCGVAVKNDATKFRKDFDFQVNGVIELSKIAKMADPERWRSRPYLISLRDLCRIYLYRKLNKDQVIRGGDWSKRQLNTSQLHYAANDAYVGLEILHSLAGLIIKRDPIRETNIFEHEDVKKALLQVEVNASEGSEGKENQKSGTSSKTAKESVKSVKLFSVKAVHENLSDQDFEFEAIAEERKLAKAKRRRSASISLSPNSKTKSPTLSPSPKSKKTLPAAKKDDQRLSSGFKTIRKGSPNLKATASSISRSSSSSRSSSPTSFGSTYRSPPKPTKLTTEVLTYKNNSRDFQKRMLLQRLQRAKERKLEKS